MRVLTVEEAGWDDVYNLTVDSEHEYFANGVLVSNCDALRYIIAYVKGAKQELWYRQGDAERSPERPEAAQGLPLPFADHERPRWNPGR